MINSVRNTVMFLLNKDNRGYVSPSEFDYFAKLAQLEIFESYFYEYGKAVALQNSRKKAQNYGDTVAHLQNKIDIFYKQAALQFTGDDVTPVESNFFSLPNDMNKLINITYGGGFSDDEIQSGGTVIDKVAPHKFDMIVNSNYTQPTVTHPVYVRKEGLIYVRPLSIVSSVQANYIKTPEDPHWGYTVLGGDPVYNQSSSTDFEISEEDQAELIIKICKYAGLSITEADIVQLISQQEQLEYQKENL